MAQKMFVKLGKKASMFYSPAIDLKVLPGQVVEVSAMRQTDRKLIKAIGGGHLVTVSENDANKGIDKSPATSKKTETPLSEFTKAQLYNKLEETFEIDEADWVEIKKLDKPSLLSYYENLEKYSE